MNKKIKIAINNVEITQSKEVEDIDGNVFQIWDETSVQSYGKEKLNHELALNDIERIRLEMLNPVEDKANQQKENNDEKIELLEIKTLLEEIVNEK